MNKLKLIIILFIIPHLLKAQSVDLSSVDAFFDVTSSLKSGKEVSNDQWSNFDNSTVYKQYSNREDKFIINTIKESIQLVFGETETSNIDSILYISKEEMTQNKELLVKKLFVDNYIKINDKYEDIIFFRNSYDFEGLVNESKLKLSSFLGHPIDSLTGLKSLYFFFASADAADKEDAIIADLNLIYRQSEEQRIELIAHEYFHNYRERFENHDFNYKCDLNYMIDMIQNEGIADMIDKTEGYEKYYSNDFHESELSTLMVELYNSAEKDLQSFHDLVIEYSLNNISKDSMVDGIIEIVKFNGHPIGFYMANKIVNAGYKKQMTESFYDPFEFYKLYNKAAGKSNSFQLSDEFMEFIFEREN
jgi:hypothetical protein